MGSAVNMIGKQYVEVSLDAGGIDPFEFRERLSMVCTLQLLPEIEKLFVALAPGDDVLCFDMLDIDVGELVIENWESNLVEKVIQKLREYISPSSSLITYSTNFLNGSKGKPRENVVSRKRTLKEKNIDTLAYFLRTGRLPWESAIKKREELIAVMGEIARGDHTGFIDLVRLIQSDIHALDRLVAQFPEELIYILINRYAKISERQFSQLHNVVSTILTRVHQETKQRQAKNASCYLVGLIKPLNGKKDTVEFIDEVFGCLLEDKVVVDLLFTVKKNSEVARQGKNLVSTMYKSLTGEIDDKFSSEIRTVLFRRLDRFAREGSGISSSMESQSSEKVLRTSKPAFKLDQDSECDETFFIHNAGLVILHPFLSGLFENVGYIENKVWVNEDSQQRAITLLQFLISGQDSFPEFDLLLNKQLVGYPLEKTLPADIQLSEYEKQEGEDLLKSVINHWPALKNTSIDGLRTSFLQREGKLYKKDLDWYLHVEQKTIDILMDRLPWGISIIKTPWMKTMLRVEWT